MFFLISFVDHLCNCHHFWAIGGILCCHNIFRLDRHVQATVSHLFCLMLHFCRCLCVLVEMRCCKLQFHCWWVILTWSISTLLHGNGKFIQATLTGLMQASSSCQLLWLLLFYYSYLREKKLYHNVSFLLAVAPWVCTCPVPAAQTTSLYFHVT